MLDDFLNYLAAERRFSPLTVRNYRRDIERFLAWLDVDESRYDFSRVEAKEIRDWILFRTGRDKVGAASMNRELSSLRALFRWLHERGCCPKNILLGIPSLRTPRRLPSFVPESRMNAIVADCYRTEEEFEAARNALIVLMFYTCGLRLAELIGIDRDDFADDLSTLRVRGKGGKTRLVPIPEFVREKIAAYTELAERQQICNSAEKALYLSLEGRRISRSTVYRIVKAELGRHGVQGKTSPHVLRHTFATHLLNDGADMRAIQELLGHASLQSTQVYTHNEIAKLKESYSKAHPREKKGQY